MAKTQAEQIQELNVALTEVSTRLQILIVRLTEQEKQLEPQRLAGKRSSSPRSAAADERIAHLRAEVTALREELRLHLIALLRQ